MAADPSSKYDIRHQIGKGSFGSVFQVTHKEERRDYVLKRVRLAKQTKWQRNSTLQERDLVSALRHPFIVPCVETWMVSDHTVNMIYGYCERGDLATYLQKIQKQRSQVDEALMVKWLCQLLLALDYLQAKRVLHRDIKTSNLLLTADMDVQLGDFGLATLMQGAGEGSMPQDTNLVGTPHYMSPELLSCRAYGFKTDVWSLGVVMYELTAQRPTFNAFNIHGLVSKIKRNKLAPLPDCYSQEWRGIINLMLQKNPERRPSVQELMALPELRPAMLQARARALQLMPDAPLPPLLEPTPFLLPQRRSGSDAATDSDGSVVSAGGAGRTGCAGSASRTAGLQSAMQASELTELFRVNSLQAKDQMQPAKQQQQEPEQDLQQQQPDRLTESCSEQWGLRTDTIGSSRYSSSSRGSSRGPGVHLLPNTPPSTGLLDSCRRVAQPGIKRTPAERVAAAIAAARAAQQQAAAVGDAGGDAPAALQGGTDAASAARNTVPRLPLAAVAVAAAAGRPWPASAREATSSRQGAPAGAAAAGGSSSSRPRSGALSARGTAAAAAAAGKRSTPREADKPVWRMSSSLSARAAGSSARQQQQQQRIKSATAGRPGQQAAAGALSEGRHTHFLQQLQEPGGDAEQARLPAQQTQLSGNSSLTPGFAAQQQQEQCISGGGDTGSPAAGCLQAGDDEDEEDSSSCCGGDSAVKQLRFDSASPAVSSRRASDSATPLDMMTPAAATPSAAGGATPPPAPADVPAAAGVAAAATVGQDDSPELWSMPGACRTAASRSSSVAAGRSSNSKASSSSAGGQEAAANAFGDSHNAAVDAGSAAMAAAAGDAAGAVADASAEQQRAELLESVVRLLGGLYARGRWQELGSVLATPGLLPDSLRPAVQASSRAKRSLDKPAASSQSRGAAGAAGGDRSTAQQAGAQLRLGDVVVLGSKRIRGKIRYIGPVAWDASGQDWVGMALDSPCGVDSLQGGVQYFDCPSRCAAFHKASLLTSRRPGGASSSSSSQRCNSGSRQC